jgi:hypothetical protein
MELIVVLAAAVPIIALLAAIWLVIRRLGPRAAALRMERERLESIVAGHLDMAESHATTAEELQPKVTAHREAAADHARRADELEQRLERERRHAEFHEQRASESEDERGRI